MGALLGETGGGSLIGDCEGYVEKALERGISLHRSPAGET
jgi:3-dehydroquinate synthetase